VDASGGVDLLLLLFPVFGGAERDFLNENRFWLPDRDDDLEDEEREEM
jgi:hypothetical protein